MYNDKINHSIIKAVHDFVNVEKQIKFLYDNMNIHNEEIFNRQLDKLIESEYELFSNLNITEKNSQDMFIYFLAELDVSHNFNNRIDLTNNIDDQILKENFRKYINNMDKKAKLNLDSITERFENILIQTFRDKPKKVIGFNVKGNKEANINLIKYQAMLDYHTSTARFLDDLQRNTDNEKEANEALKVKNKIFFTYKEVAERFNSGNITPQGYENCINNHQNIELVNNTFKEYLNHTLNENAKYCYLYTDKELSNKDTRIYYNINLQFLKAALYQLDTQKLKEVVMNYETDNIKATRQSMIQMFEEMDNLVELKEKEDHVKKLTKIK